MNFIPLQRFLFNITFLMNAHSVSRQEEQPSFADLRKGLKKPIANSLQI